MREPPLKTIRRDRKRASTLFGPDTRLDFFIIYFKSLIYLA
jgi:hypothetical protein